jgi:hypothetical protein
VISRGIFLGTRIADDGGGAEDRRLRGGGGVGRSVFREGMV